MPGAESTLKSAEDNKVASKPRPSSKAPSRLATPRRCIRLPTPAITQPTTQQDAEETPNDDDQKADVDLTREDLLREWEHDGKQPLRKRPVFLASTCRGITAFRQLSAPWMRLGCFEGLLHWQSIEEQKLAIGKEDDSCSACDDTSPKIAVGVRIRVTHDPRWGVSRKCGVVVAQSGEKWKVKLDGESREIAVAGEKIETSRVPINTTAEYVAQWFEDGDDGGDLHSTQKRDREVDLKASIEAEMVVSQARMEVITVEEHGSDLVAMALKGQGKYKPEQYPDREGRPRSLEHSQAKLWHAMKMDDDGVPVT